MPSSTSGSLVVARKAPRMVNTYDPKLGGRRLFHGSSVCLKPGELILPIGKVAAPVVVNAGSGKQRLVYPGMVFAGISDPEVAYATEDIDDAKHFAMEAARLAWARMVWNGLVCAYVYEVEPLGLTKIRKIPKDSPGVKRLEHRSTEGYRVIRLVLSKAPPLDNGERYRSDLEYDFRVAPWSGQ